MSRPSRLRRSAAIGVLVSATLFAAGCTPAAPDAAEPVSLDLSEKVSPAWEVSNDSVSAAPAVVGDSVIVYEQRSGAVSLVAYSAADGSELWAQESSTGSVKTGTRLYPAVVETSGGSPLVGMVTPPVLDEAANQWEHTIRLVNPETGEAVAESPRFWAGDLFTCENDLCAGWWDPAQQKFADARLSADGTFVTGEYLRRRAFDGVPSRWLTDNVYLAVNADGSPSDFIVTNGDDIVKRTPAEELIPGFEGDAFYLLGGAQLMEDDGVFIVSSNSADSRNSSDVVYTSDDFVTFGLDSTTGDLLWQKPGYLPCAIDKGVFCKGADVGYRQDESSSNFELEGGDATLVALDPKTGDEDWTYEAKDLSGVGNGTQAKTMISPKGQFAFVEAGAPMLLTLATGMAEPLEKGDRVGCYAEKTFLAPEYSNPANLNVAFDGALVTNACGPDGEDTDPADFTTGVASGGVQKWLPSGEKRDPADQFYVVQADGKLLAYKL